MTRATGNDESFMRRALALARRGYGTTSPNPMVGAVLVKGGRIIGQGWHHCAGKPHAEIEALRDAERRKNSPKGATLYVTLEPCCTHGRTPPCTDAIKAAGIKRVVAAATDPNPKHSGKGLTLLRKAGIEVLSCEGRARRSARAVGGTAAKQRARSDAPYHALAEEATKLNEAFNHWIVQRTPFVTVKAAMTLDGKIATASGESKWITGEKARAEGMRLRAGADAILIGVNTVLADDPGLTLRQPQSSKLQAQKLRRIILDSQARTPLKAKVVSDEFAALTTIVVGKGALAKRVAALAKRVQVWTVPLRGGRIDLRWVLKKLGDEKVTSLLVEGGGEVNASFLLGRFAQRVEFFYAPKILGGRDSRKAVAGEGARSLNEILNLHDVEWRRVGEDLMMTARVEERKR